MEMPENANKLDGRDELILIIVAIITPLAVLLGF